MSGRKVFTAGEVLQAADVNDFLMDQSVMVFAGTAARGSAIPSPTEGMVTYLKDANELQVFNGSSFTGVGGGGLVHISTTSFTTVSSQAINNVFSANYTNYKIIVHGLHSSTSAVAINMRMRASGTDNSTNNYFYSYNTVDASSTEVNVGAGSQSLWIVGLWGDGSGMLDITLTNPNTAARFNFSSLFASAGTTFGVTGRSAGTFNAATAFDGFSLIPASGTITGTVSVYGFEV